MRLKFDEQLRQLNNEMILMGNMIQKAIQDTIEAFFSQNIDKAKQIMKDDELVDQEQKKIESILHKSKQNANRIATVSI